MKLARKKQMPARYDTTGTIFQFDDVPVHHRSQFYESVDVLVSTIDWRLDEQSLKPALTLEQLLVNATTSSDVDDELLKLVQTYHPHLDAKKLKAELFLLRGHKIPSTIAGIISWFQELDLHTETHKSIYMAVATFLVLPATCERTFSELRRVKSYLRSSMGQERLDSSILAAAHVNILDSLDVSAIAQDFISVYDIRIKHYGTFK